MVGKSIFRSKQFSLVLPQGWAIDTNQTPIIVSRKQEDAGAIQISTFSSDKPMKDSEIDPKSRLENHIKRQTKDKVKIKTYERMGCKTAISDFYKLTQDSEERCWKMMVAMTKNRMAFITYNVEWKFRNARLEDIEEIFDSFMLES